MKTPKGEINDSIIALAKDEILMKETEVGILTDDELDAVAGGQVSEPTLDGPGSIHRDPIELPIVPPIGPIVTE
ncbi:MAG: hypothetical protein ACOX4A_08225 [Saccharofermentanales bacterium]|jgi:hypothetical protein